MSLYPVTIFLSQVMIQMIVESAIMKSWQKVIDFFKKQESIGINCADIERK